MTTTLRKRPDAATYAIEDLVPLACSGTVRIPRFQRPFRWRPSDIRDLFDSIYRGFPIGTLLFWKKGGEAGRVKLGPLEIDVPDQSDALWIVDGQQRITSLVGTLAAPQPPEEFDLHFDLSWDDAAEHEPQRSPFAFPDPRRPFGTSWLPMRVVLDSEALDAWLDESGARTASPDYVKRARRLNKLVREYKIPAYIVETNDTETLGLIFDRVNTAGKRLERSEVFNALLRSTGEGLSLADAGRRVTELGFGGLDHDLLLKVVLVTSGIDVTTATARSLHEIRDLADAMATAETVLGRAIELLRKDAGIPHVTLLPYTFPVLALSRLLQLHPSPTPRSRALLARWVWRGAISGEHRAERTPAVRATLKAIDDAASEEEAVQRLLATVPSTPPEPQPFTFRFGTAQAKIVLAALASLGPRHLTDGDPLDVGATLAAHGPKAALSVTPKRTDVDGEARDLGNVLLHPPIGRGVLESALASASIEVLTTHGFDLEAADALRRRDYRAAVTLRDARLRETLGRWLAARARWDESDRPSLGGLLQGLEDEVGD